jgi:hypothetical protein
MKNIKNAVLKISPLLFMAWIFAVGYGSYLHVRHTLLNNSSFFTIGGVASLEGPLVDETELTGQSAAIDEDACGCPSCCAIKRLL